MNMVDFDFLLSDKNVTLLDSRDVLCSNPDHGHSGHAVPAIKVEIAGVVFDINKDHGKYNIEANEDDLTLRTELSRIQVLEYIDDWCVSNPD